MGALEAVRAELPEAAKDVRLNLQSVLEATSLTPAQRWEVAIASAIAARSPRLRDALVTEAMGEVSSHSGLRSKTRASSTSLMKWRTRPGAGWVAPAGAAAGARPAAARGLPPTQYPRAHVGGTNSAPDFSLGMTFLPR